MWKLLTLLVALILIVLAAEGGYYVALIQAKRERAATPSTLLSPPPVQELSPSPMFPPLFSPETTATLSGIPKDFVTESELTVGVWGKLIRMEKESLTMSFDGKIHQFQIPGDLKIVLTKWSVSRQSDSEAKASEFLVNNDVTVYLTMETMTGKILRMQLTKEIE